MCQALYQELVTQIITSLAETLCKENKSEYNKRAFPNFVSENSAGRCFSKEMFHSQLILQTLGKHKEIFSWITSEDFK